MMGRKRKEAHRGRIAKVTTVATEKQESKAGSENGHPVDYEDEDPSTNENVLFSLDQVVDAARECNKEIDAMDPPEGEENLIPGGTIKVLTDISIDDKDLVDTNNNETDIIPGTQEQLVNNSLEESPGLLNITIAPFESLKQNGNIFYSESFSQEPEGFEMFSQSTPPHEKLKDELVSVNEIETQNIDDDNSLKNPQPMTSEEKAYFKLVAESNNLEKLKDLISQNNAILPIFHSGNNEGEGDDGCLTQHFVSYTQGDDGMQEVEASQIEGFQPTAQALHLPSGEVIHLEEGENFINLDENMNFISYQSENTSCSQHQLDAEEKDIKSTEGFLQRFDDMAMPKNFSCDLCPETFEKKLQLNNHKDRRHGVKFVFTEKGKKVKLVRLPKDFEFRTGEKLDPCVSLLIEATQSGRNPKQGAIGVQVVEELDDPRRSFHVLGHHQGNIAAPTPEKEEVVTNENWESFKIGFLIEIIKTEAYEKTKVRNQTPFVAFYPSGVESSFLLRIVPVNSEKHLLVPATTQDVVHAKGAEFQGTSYIYQENQEAGSSREVLSNSKRDYKIPIVATIHQILDEELRRYVLEVQPPMKDKPVKKIDIMEPEQFTEYARQCQGEKVRTLSEAANPMPPPKPRKPYQRRAVRSLAAALSQAATTTPSESIPTVAPDAPTEHQDQVTPLVSDPEKIIRSRRCIKKEFIDPEELADPSYEPTPRTKPVASTISVTGTGRKRGRPRKIVPEGLADYPPKSQKRPRKQHKELTELIQAVENIMKKEKTCDGYEEI